jgi:hypothetical protein
MKKSIISLAIFFSVSLAGAQPLSIEELAAQIKADEDSARNNQQPEQRQIIRRPEIRTFEPKPAPEYGNLQSEAIAFSKRIPAYLYQHQNDSLANLVANEASKHDYNGAETKRFLEIVNKELIANGVIKPTGEVITPDHRPPMTADEAERRMIERFQIPGKARITGFHVPEKQIPIYSASIEWEITTRVPRGIGADGLQQWSYETHSYAGRYDFLADRISSRNDY